MLGEQGTTHLLHADRPGAPKTVEPDFLFRCSPNPMPDGTLVVVDKISGIPYNASPDKWEFELITKGDPSYPSSATCRPLNTGRVTCMPHLMFPRITRLVPDLGPT